MKTEIIEFQNRFRSLQAISRNLLKPILKNPKFNFFYTISLNLSNVINIKYIDYCKLKKVTLDKEGKQGNVYIISYNSAVSFYLNNNKQYIIEKINTLFGYNAVINLFIQEVPTLIKKNNINKEQKQNKDVILKTNITNEILKQSLIELGKTL